MKDMDVNELMNEDIDLEEMLFLEDVMGSDNVIGEFTEPDYTEPDSFSMIQPVVQQSKVSSASSDNKSKQEESPKKEGKQDKKTDNLDFSSSSKNKGENKGTKPKAPVTNNDSDKMFDDISCKTDTPTNQTGVDKASETINAISKEKQEAKTSEKKGDIPKAEQKKSDQQQKEPKKETPSLDDTTTLTSDDEDVYKDIDESIFERVSEGDFDYGDDYEEDPQKAGNRPNMDSGVYSNQGQTKAHEKQQNEEGQTNGMRSDHDNVEFIFEGNPTPHMHTPYRTPHQNSSDDDKADVVIIQKVPDDFKNWIKKACVFAAAILILLGVPLLFYFISSRSKEKKEEMTDNKDSIVFAETDNGTTEDNLIYLFGPSTGNDTNASKTEEVLELTEEHTETITEEVTEAITEAPTEAPTEEITEVTTEEQEKSSTEKPKTFFDEASDYAYGVVAGGTGSSRFNTLEDLTFYLDSTMNAALSSERQAVASYKNRTITYEELADIVAENTRVADELNHLLLINKYTYIENGELDIYNELSDNLDALIVYGDAVLYQMGN